MFADLFDAAFDDENQIKTPLNNSSSSKFRTSESSGTRKSTSSAARLLKDVEVSGIPLRGRFSTVGRRDSFSKIDSGKLEPSSAANRPPEPSSAKAAANRPVELNSAKPSVYRPVEPSSANPLYRTLEPNSAKHSYKLLEPSSAKPSYKPLEPSSAKPSYKSLEPSSAKPSYKPLEPSSAKPSYKPLETSSTKPVEHMIYGTAPRAPREMNNFPKSRRRTPSPPKKRSALQQQPAYNFPKDLVLFNTDSRLKDSFQGAATILHTYLSTWGFPNLPTLGSLKTGMGLSPPGFYDMQIFFVKRFGARDDEIDALTNPNDYSRLFKEVGYPSLIAKSHFQHPTAPTTWSQHLSALSWMSALMLLYESEKYFPIKRLKNRNDDENNLLSINTFQGWIGTGAMSDSPDEDHHNVDNNTTPDTTPRAEPVNSKQVLTDIMREAYLSSKVGTERDEQLAGLMFEACEAQMIKAKQQAEEASIALQNANRRLEAEIGRQAAFDNQNECKAELEVQIRKKREELHVLQAEAERYKKEKEAIRVNYATIADALTEEKRALDEVKAKVATQDISTKEVASCQEDIAQAQEQIKKLKIDMEAKEQWLLEVTAKRGRADKVVYNALGAVARTQKDLFRGCPTLFDENMVKEKFESAQNMNDAANELKKEFEIQFRQIVGVLESQRLEISKAMKMATNQKAMAEKREKQYNEDILKKVQEYQETQSSKTKEAIKTDIVELKKWNKEKQSITNSTQVSVELEHCRRRERTALTAVKSAAAVLKKTQTDLKTLYISRDSLQEACSEAIIAFAKRFPEETVNQKLLQFDGEIDRLIEVIRDI